MNWRYKDSPILSHDDLHPECTDIVYELCFDDNTRYIGKYVIYDIIAYIV